MNRDDEQNKAPVRVTRIPDGSVNVIFEQIDEAMAVGLRDGMSKAATAMARKYHIGPPVIAPEFAEAAHNCSDHHHARRDLGHDLLMWTCVACSRRTFTYVIDAPVSVADEVAAIKRAPVAHLHPHRWWTALGLLMAFVGGCAFWSLVLHILGVIP